MEKEQSKINPWVRANLGQHCDETLALIPEPLKEMYHFVMDELTSASQGLGIAQERYAASVVLRNEFFEGLAYGTPKRRD